MIVALIVYLVLHTLLVPTVCAGVGRCSLRFRLRPSKYAVYYTGKIAWWMPFLLAGREKCQVAWAAVPTLITFE